MGEIIIQRRGFILGAALSLFAAPAIVKASNLMAVRPFEVLAATGFEPPVDWSSEYYLAQYRSFQKGFLADYRKESDPVRAAVFPVADFASKWSGDHIQRVSTAGRALADDGPVWNIDAQKRRIANGGDETWEIDINPMTDKDKRRLHLLKMEAVEKWKDDVYQNIVAQGFPGW